MDIKSEIEKQLKYGFSQKEIVEDLLQKGFLKEDIKNNIGGYVKNVDTKFPAGSFLVSLIGQFLILAYFGTGSGRYPIFLLITLIALASTIGFLLLKKHFVIIWIIIFVMFFIFSLISYFFTTWGNFYFVFALFASLCAKLTFTVYEKINNTNQVYEFD